jgi:hypothetical protein
LLKKQGGGGICTLQAEKLFSCGPGVFIDELKPEIETKQTVRNAGREGRGFSPAAFGTGFNAGL